MRNISSNLFNVLVCFILVSSGFIIGKYQSFPTYYFKKDFDIVGIAAIFVNVFLAWYIARIIGKKNDIDKKDKEIVLARLDKMISNLELFMNQVHSTSNNLNYFEVISFFKRNTDSIDRLCKNFSQYHSINYNGIDISIKKELRYLLNLTTYTPPISSAFPIPNFQEPVTITNDIISFSTVRADEIYNKIDIIIDQIIKLQLFINSK